MASKRACQNGWCVVMKRLEVAGRGLEVVREVDTGALAIESCSLLNSPGSL